MWYNIINLKDRIFGKVKKEQFKMTKVNSSLINGIDYDAGAEKLSVSMRSNNATYTYAGVSQKLVNELTSAKSKGQFFNRNIRGRFPATKISG